MNRKLVWGVPVAMVIAGLIIVLLAYAQPARVATVTERGEVYYTPAKRVGRSRRSARYRATLTVVYGNDEGEIQARVDFSTMDLRKIPKPGDEIAVTPWLNGMVPHPNRTLIVIGGTGIVIGGLFLFLFLLTAWNLKRQRKLHGEGREE